MFSWLIAAPCLALVQEVVLVPGTINGTIQVGTDIITSASISASGAHGSASSTITPNANSVAYGLTVNVPQGASTTYSVLASVSLRPDSSSPSTFMTLGSRTVTVAETSPGLANFVINPGIIQGTITVAGGGTLNHATLTAASATASASVAISGESYRLPILAGSGITVGGSVVVNGVSVPLQPRTVAVGAGQGVIVNFTVQTPAPTATGAIEGIARMNGPFTPHAHFVSVSGPVFRSVFTSAVGHYRFNDLPPGNYFVFAQTFFNGFATGFVHPPSSYSVVNRQSVPVSAGATTIVDVTSNEAFIGGTLTLRGTSSLADVRSGVINATGVSGGASAGASAFDLYSTTTGAYDLVVNDGRWTVGDVSFDFFRPNPNFLDQHLGFSDVRMSSNPVVISTGETVINNVIYEMGTVTLAFRVADGRLLSLPRLEGFCRKLDTLGQTEWAYSFQSFSSSNQQNVAEGRVTFVGMEGTCTVRPFATVSGSLTQFGEFVIDVVPGVHQVVSIGGPRVTMEVPEPGLITSDSAIVVTGSATDDVTVANVTVSGAHATLVSTNNPRDPAEVAFSAAISLNLGPNEIITTATDDAGKTGSDVRTIYRDDGPPVLAWAPADGAVVTTAAITVQGTAADDAGVASISVDGRPVSFQSATNATDARSVSFRGSLTLLEGENFITVVATDISGRNTSQTHRVIFTPTPPDTTPPVTTATQSPAPNAHGWNNGEVTVTLTATDGTGGSGVARIEFSLGGAQTATGAVNSGATVKILAEGVTTLTYAAVDVAGNREAAQSLTVRIDRALPTIVCGAAPGPNTAGWNNTDVTISFVAADGLSGIESGPPPVVVTTEGANQAVTRTVIDRAGNQASATCPVSIDKTPPLVTFTRTPAANELGWNKTDVTVTFSATDALSGVIDLSGPVTLVTEGIDQVVRGTAVDRAGNVGSVTTTVNIDKTPPELQARCQPGRLGQLVVIGRSGTAQFVSVVPPEHVDHGNSRRQETYRIIDVAGNTLDAVFGLKAEDHELRFTLLLLSYNGGTPVTPAENIVKCEWAFEKGGTRLKELEQKLEIGHHTADVRAKFRAARNATEIRVHRPEPDRRTTQAGVVFLGLTTSNGQVGF